MNEGVEADGCPRWEGDQALPPDVLDRVIQSVRALRKRAVRDRDLCAWHQKLFCDLVPIPYYAGNFRQIHKHKPCLAMRVAVADVEGSHPSVVIAEMSAFNGPIQAFFALRANWKGTPDDALTLAVELAKCIGQFIRIHPFRNGNGRVSRLLWAWGLWVFSFPQQVPVTPRPRPPDPYEAVMAAAMRGDDQPLAEHILDF